MPPTRPDDDPIGFLLERRFPNHELIIRTPTSPISASWSAKGTLTPEAKQQLLRQVEAYRNELKAKTPEELGAIIAKARSDDAALWRARIEKEEQGRFFNQYGSKADYDHWSRAAYWTLEEAVALTFGKNPEVVTWDRIRSITNVSEFAGQYARVRDLVIRAKNWNQLYDPAVPGFYLAWAARNDLHPPEELVRAVEERGNHIADWKDLFEKQKEEYLKLGKDRDHVFEVLQKVAAERDALQARVADLEQKVGAWQFDENAENYPAELDIAMQAWRATSNQRDPSMTVKQQVSAWLGRTYPKLSDEARERIKTICNWEKRGGRRPKEF